MVTNTHPTIDKQALNVTLVSAELVTTRGLGIGAARQELVLTFANEGVAATHYQVRMLIDDLRTSAV